MSKKVFNVFSILCFALVLCFIGCTELINPKTETDINLNIDLSKIIKSTRNTEEIQSSVSIGENPTIKVAIYDAKKYNATTNSTDNLDLITEAQAKIANNEAKVKLNNIPVGIDAIVFAELSFSNGNSTEVMYAGNSEVFRVKPTDNKISLVLIKVEVDIEVDIEVKPDDSKPEEIINAKEPEIIIQPISCVKTTTESTTGGTTKTTLTCTAKSTDGGNLSFMWYKSEDSTYFEEFSSIVGPSLNDDGSYTSSTSEIEAQIGQRLYFYCVVTNTNENATGNKVASVRSNTVQVACIEGILSSISATYKSDSYELLGKDFNYNNVTVKEIYTSGSDNAKTITVFADKSRYTISPTTDSKDAIGYVPYTVTHNDSNLTKDITVPVKYELNANNLVLETCVNSICVSESDTDNAIKIPQYGTVKYVYRISDNTVTPYKLIEQNNEHTGIKDINSDEEYFKATITSYGTNIENEATCYDVGTYTYTVTLESVNEWFVCNSNNTSKDFSVKVCPWEIILTTNDGSTVDESNLSEKTSYSLSINNDAIPSGFNYYPYLESLSSSFPIQDYILTTPAAIEAPQTTQIIAKCDDQQIASITVTVGAMVGSVNNPIIAWDDLKNYLEISSEEPSTIYIQGDLYSNKNAVVNRPVTIVPIGNVTITRTSESDYIFGVNKNLELQGSETSIITLAGNVDVENSQPLISCVSDVNVNLKYCTLENANCGSNSNGSVLYASNDSIIYMDYCVVQNNRGVPISLCNAGENIIVNTTFLNNASCINVNENANLVLDSCTFYNKTNSTYSGELSIYKANTITIKNTTFETVNPGYNIYAYVAPKVVLDGSLSIHSIYFDNSYGNSSLGIVCGEYLTLNDPQIPITITAVSYDENYNGEIVDINLFSLEDGKPVPDNIFTLANENYTINNTTGNIENVNSSGDGGNATQSITTFSALRSAIDKANTNSSSYTLEKPCVIYIGDSFSTDGDTALTLTISTHVKLVANNTDGCTITKTSGYAGTNIFTVSSEASLTLGDETATGILTIDGGGDDVKSIKSLIYVSPNGTLVLNKNSVLQNNICIDNYNSSNGSAVYSAEGNIQIKGGEIKNNQILREGKYGGGIYLTNGTFEMTSGIFQENSTDSYGKMYGGALYFSSCTVNITGGTFYNNSVTSTNTECYGGAICINDSVTAASPVQISNCIFKSNSAYQRGGAIYICGTTCININNCTFNDNSVTNSSNAAGGAIYVANTSGGPVTILGCNFANNTANSIENTIYNGSSSSENISVIVDETTVANSSVWNPSTSGGGIDGTYVSTAGELKSALEDTSVNTIFINADISIDSTINITRDVTIAANKAVTLTDSVTDDSCFNVTTGNLTLGGGAGNLTITSNTSYSTIQTAPSNNGKTITVKNNVTFSDCQYYCISLAANYFLIIEGGSFINNNYVPIYIASGTSAEIKMTSGTITGNNNSKKGSSFCLNSGSLTITGGTIKDNKINNTSCGASIWVSSTATATVNGESLTTNAQYTEDIEL